MDLLEGDRCRTGRRSCWRCRVCWLCGGGQFVDMGKVWVGAGPGGIGAFGVALVDGSGRTSCTTVSSVDEAVKTIAAAGTPLGVGIDAPMWWSATAGGGRKADARLRKAYRIHPRDGAVGELAPGRRARRRCAAGVASQGSDARRADHEVAPQGTSVGARARRLRFRSAFRYPCDVGRPAPAMRRSYGSFKVDDRVPEAASERYRTLKAYERLQGAGCGGVAAPEQLGISRRTLYRWQAPKSTRPRRAVPLQEQGAPPGRTGAQGPPAARVHDPPHHRARPGGRRGLADVVGFFSPSQRFAVQR